MDTLRIYDTAVLSACLLGRIVELLFFLSLIDTVDSHYNKLLGPSEIAVISKVCYIRVSKTMIYKEILNFGTKKITVISGCCYIGVLYNESPLYVH